MLVARTPLPFDYVKKLNRIANWWEYINNFHLDLLEDWKHVIHNISALILRIDAIDTIPGNTI